MVFLTLILKSIILSILEKLSCIIFNEYKLDKNGDNSVSSSKINNKIVNLLSNTKKISSKVGFLTFKAKLV